MVQLLCFRAKNVSKIGPNLGPCITDINYCDLCPITQGGRQAGWPDWGSFCQLGYFGELNVILWKYEVVQSNGDIIGYALLQQIFYIVMLTHFQNMVCCRYLKGFKSGLIKMFWTFTLSFDGMVTVLTTIFNWVIFFYYLEVTLLVGSKMWQSFYR